MTHKKLEKTDIFGEYAIWAWGKDHPAEISEAQEFLRKSPIGKYIESLEQEIKKEREKRLSVEGLADYLRMLRETKEVKDFRNCRLLAEAIINYLGGSNEG